MKHVLKWDVPLDGRFHDIGRGKIVHVGIQGAHPSVQVWTEEIIARTGDDELLMREARIYGTGYDIPDELDHVGTVLDGLFVWHVYASPWCKVRT